jgi:hypothetical protein
MQTTTYQPAHAAQMPPILRYLDVVILALGVVIALALGAPALGCLVGAGGWLLQRVVQTVDRRATAKIDDSLRRAGVSSFEAFGRIWLLAGAIVIAAVAGGRKDGLAAAIVVFATYSVAFAMRLMSGPPPARGEGQR